MGRKAKTIYERFPYTREEIDDMIKNDLSEEERKILWAKNGDDFDHPVSIKDFDKKYGSRYYKVLIPKMELILAKNQNMRLKEELEEQKSLKNLERVSALINTGKTSVEICEKLGINNEELSDLLHRLKKYGLFYSKRYYSNGTIKYKPIYTVSNLKRNFPHSQNKIIITDSLENNMKFLLISNLCFGSRYERLDLVYRAFDYCKKNGINIILCGGNIIDGFSTSKKQGISDIRKQVEYAVKNYPSDKNILTFSVLGDRDLNALSNEGIYLEEFFLNHRPDVIFGGFNNTYIYIKNDIILLYHYLSGGRMLSPKGSIVLHGHASKYMTTFINDILNITIPSLSDMNQSVPSALELNLKFNNGFIETANVKQVCFMEKDTVLNEVGFDFPKNETKKMDRILNTEDYRKDIPTGKIK